jgi:hypothetical protein
MQAGLKTPATAVDIKYHHWELRVWTIYNQSITSCLVAEGATWCQHLCLAGYHLFPSFDEDSLLLFPDGPVLLIV